MNPRRYHPATRSALLRHVVEQRGFVHTYLLAHRRVTRAEIDAILDGLYDELVARLGPKGQAPRRG
jgi:hypothetical protein